MTGRVSISPGKGQKAETTAPTGGSIASPRRAASPAPASGLVRAAAARCFFAVGRASRLAASSFS